MDTDDVVRMLLMFFIMPLWLVAGFADYLCHRAAHIERTSGWKESLLHLLQFVEMGIPVLAGLFLQINAGIIVVMIVCFLLHEATAIWDVHYASATRDVSPIEQHVHSFLEMLPLMGLLMIISLYWAQFIALFGFGEPQFAIALKPEPLPWRYVTAMLGATLLFEFLPYVEELIRSIRRKSPSDRRPSA